MSTLPEKLYSRAAEESVIGSLLIDPDALDRCVEIVKPGDFFIGYLARIYGQIITMASHGHDVNVITVPDAMQGEPPPENGAGWVSTIAILARDTPSAANIAAYAGIVKNFSLRRQVFAAGVRISETARRELEGSKALAESSALLEAVANNDQPQQAAISLNESLSLTVDDIDKRFNADQDIIGLPTGLADVDAHLSGLWPGSLYVVAGRPGMGKSIFGIQAAGHCAIRENKPALLFSLEMPHRQIARRILAAHGRVALNRLITGKLQDEDWPSMTAAVSLSAHAPLYIQDRSSLHIRDMIAETRRFHRQTPLSLVLVDYLQLMQGDGENRTQEIGSISRGLKSLAMELDIPVLALAQLSRDVEKRGDKRPMMADLRDSGTIEQDADVIAFLYRDEVYNPDSQYKGSAEFLIRKFRDGETGMVPLGFQGEFARFITFAKPWVEQYESQVERGMV